MITRIPERWRPFVLITAFVITLIFLSGRWMFFFDSPIEGYVIDAETGKPLEGAVVGGLWELTQFPSHGSDGYAKISLESSRFHSG